MRIHHDSRGVAEIEDHTSAAEEVLSLLDLKLSTHIQGIDLEALSRTPLKRFVEKSVPHIGVIELVSADVFSNVYNDLYISMFPHQAQREASRLIIDRLHNQFANQRKGLAPYRVLGIRDHQGKAICAAQFSVLLLPDTKYAVPYLQYIYTREQNRRQNMADLLHTLILAVSTADSKTHGNRSVPFTLFETEPAGYGKTEKDRANATQRAMIYTKAGAVAIMLRRSSDGSLLSPHIQPGLEVGDPPLSLVWAIRKTPGIKLASDSPEIRDVGLSLIAACYQSLRDEGFPEANIALAEEIVARRCEGRDFVLMPLGDVVVPHNIDIETRLTQSRHA